MRIEDIGEGLVGGDAIEWFDAGDEEAGAGGGDGLVGVAGAAEAEAWRRRGVCGWGEQSEVGEDAADAGTVGGEVAVADASATAALGVEAGDAGLEGGGEGAAGGDDGVEPEDGGAEGDGGGEAAAAELIRAGVGADEEGHGVVEAGAVEVNKKIRLTDDALGEEGGDLLGGSASG